MDGLHLSPDAMPHLVELLEPFLEDMKLPVSCMSSNGLCSIVRTSLPCSATPPCALSAMWTATSFSRLPALASEVSRHRTGHHNNDNS